MSQAKNLFGESLWHSHDLSPATMPRRLPCGASLPSSWHSFASYFACYRHHSRGGCVCYRHKKTFCYTGLTVAHKSYCSLCRHLFLCYWCALFVYILFCVAFSQDEGEDFLLVCSIAICLTLYFMEIGELWKLENLCNCDSKHTTRRWF